MVIPTLAPLEIAGKTITADALLTQRKLAGYLLGRNAHSVFTAKDNQPTLREAIRLLRCRPWRAERGPVVPGRRRRGRVAGEVKGR